MNILEKRARFTLKAFAITVLVYLGVSVFLIACFNAPVSVAFSKALSFLGLFGCIVIFTPLIGRKERRKAKILMDERDRAIEKSASYAGFGGSYVVFIATCLIAYLTKGMRGKVSVDFLILIVVLGVTALFTVRAFVILILYRRGGYGTAGKNQ